MFISTQTNSCIGGGIAPIPVINAGEAASNETETKKLGFDLEDFVFPSVTFDMSIRDIGYAADFYNTVYVINPDTGFSSFDITSPIVGFNYEFKVWSAYRQSSTVDSITAFNDEGLFNSSMGEEPIAFDRLRLNAYYFNILDNAPPFIAAEYTYETDYGGFGTLTINVLNSQIVVDPFVEYTQTLSFKTDIIESQEGVEQRIARFRHPKETVEISSKIQDRALYLPLFKKYNSTINSLYTIPLWNDRSYLLNDVLSSDTTIFINPTYLNRFDVGVTVVIARPLSDRFDWASARVETLNTSTGEVSLSTPIGKNFDKTFSIVLPTISGFLDSNELSANLLRYGEKVTNYTVNKKIRGDFSNSLTSEVTYYNSTPLIDIEPMNNDGLGIKYKSKAELNFDDYTYVNIDHQIKSKVEYGFTYAHMDYFDRIKLQKIVILLRGMQKEVYVNTFTKDFELVTPLINGASSITVYNTRYTSYLYPLYSYKSIALNTNVGWVYKTVVDYVENAEGTTTLIFDSSLDGSITSLTQISQLILGRLNTDDISFTYKPLRASCTLPITTLV